MKRNKIFIITECPYSGILTAILNMSSVLVSLGFKITFIIPEKHRNRYGETSEENEKYLLKYGNVLYKPLRRKYRYIASDYFTLKKFFTGQKNYIVLSYASYAGKLCRILFKNGQINILYHVPQCIEIIRRPIWQRPIEYIFEKVLAHHCAYYLACGPEECITLTKNFHVPASKIILATNFTKKQNRSEDSKKAFYDFLIFGRVSKDKRVDLVLEATSILGAQNKVVVIGDGSELNYLRAKYPKVNFLGRINHNEIDEKIKHAKWFLSASIIEGVPFSLLESMANGVVPLVSNVKGHKDIILSGFNGFLFDNSDDLVDSIYKLLFMDDETYKKFSSNAMNTISAIERRTILTITNHFKKYE